MLNRYFVTNSTLRADADVTRKQSFAGVPFGSTLLEDIIPAPDARIEVCRVAKQGDKFIEVVVAATAGANIAAARDYAKRGRYCVAIKTDDEGKRVKIYKPARLYLRYKAKVEDKPEVAPVKATSGESFRKFWTSAHPAPAAT